MTRHGLEAADVLSGGEWRVCGGVRIWVPDVPPMQELYDCNAGAVSGTDSGYYKHRRVLKEPACGECLTAHRVAEYKRAQRRKASA